MAKYDSMRVHVHVRGKYPKESILIVINKLTSVTLLLDEVTSRQLVDIATYLLSMRYWNVVPNLAAYYAGCRKFVVRPILYVRSIESRCQGTSNHTHQQWVIHTKASRKD